MPPTLRTSKAFTLKRVAPLREAFNDIKDMAMNVRRPRMTFPPETAEALLSYYREADTILEYGSGGSTVAAAELLGKTIYSVESDPGWLCRLNMYLQNADHPSMPYLLWSDIGPTREWGHPADLEHFRKFPNYATDVWKLLGEHHRDPDVVLIDGRFRTACFLATAFRTRKRITVLFDDYAPRKYKKVVEKFSKPTSFVGKMAVFDIEPTKFDAAIVLDNLDSFLDPS